VNGKVDHEGDGKGDSKEEGKQISDKTLTVIKDLILGPVGQHEISTI
jgi:hypothetical protein